MIFIFIIIISSSSSSIMQGKLDLAALSQLQQSITEERYAIP